MTPKRKTPQPPPPKPSYLYGPPTPVLDFIGAVALTAGTLAAIGIVVTFIARLAGWL